MHNLKTDLERVTTQFDTTRKLEKQVQVHPQGTTLDDQPLETIKKEETRKYSFENSRDKIKRKHGRT